MKKFLTFLTVLFLLQVLLPNAKGFSFVGTGLTPAKQVKTNFEFTNATKEISSKSINVLLNDVDLSVQDATKNIKSNDITNAFKQSIESNTILQSGNSLWAKTFGGSRDDRVYAISQTSDGGCILEGWTNSFGAGNDDFLVVKLDSKGTLSWAKTYGGSKDDWATSIQQTVDGGYILAGDTKSFGAGNEDCLVVKLDSKGNLSWAHTFGGHSNDWAMSVSQTTDGGYILAGQYYSSGVGGSNVLVIKLNSKGTLSWAKTFGGRKDDWAISINQTTDGGYILAGVSQSFGAGGMDVLVIKLNSKGNPSWSRAFGGRKDDWAMSISQTTDGGYILAGVTYTFGAGMRDMLVIKLDSKGSPSWARTFGGSKDDWAMPIYQTSDGGYILAGYTESFGAGDIDALVIKLTSKGNLLWAHTLGGSKDDRVEAIYQTSDGGYIAAGVSQSSGAGGKDMLVIKLDSNGNIPGISCKFLKDITKRLIVKSANPSASSINPQTTTPHLFVSSPHLSTSSPHLSTSTICESTPKHSNQITIILQPNNPMMTVNGVKKEIDPGRGTKSVIIPEWGRTVVPIRAIVEALGGTIEWDGVPRKVTIHFNGNTVELWIDNPKAKVNGAVKWIDDNNHSVKPIIKNSRTMLPLRFVAESLGCKVNWNGTTRTITITYTP